MESITTSGTRLKLLESEISKGNFNELIEFWRAVEVSGAPLIEYCDLEEKSVFLTFIYRDWNPNLSIVVFGSFPGYKYRENQLIQLTGTDIWYKTFLIRNDVRFSYSFSVRERFSDDYQEITKFRFSDRLNPNKIIFDKDEEDAESERYENSLIELPFAPVRTWVNEYKGRNHGELVLHRLSELKEKEARRVWVYVPHGYDSTGQPYNLAVMFDGLEFIEKLHAKNVLDNLISQEKIVPTICVFVDNKDNRYEELTCNGEYSELIITELVPWIRKLYNVSLEPEKTMIGGFSLSGLAAAYISMNHSDVFGNVLSLSGSFWWENEKIINMYSRLPVLPLRFYLSVGLLEDEPYDSEPIMMKCVDRFYAAVRDKGNFVCYDKFHSGHDYLSWGESFGEGLICLFGSCLSNT